MVFPPVSKANMPSSSKVYIDESGDDGFVFRPNAAGSSEWFVLSAIVIRYEKDFRIVESMKATRKLLHRKENAALGFRLLRNVPCVASAS